MIYTVTFNPAIDYIANIEELNISQINKTLSEKVLAGGKGINVSIVLKNLGIESTAIGFIAGFTGEEIKRQVESFGVKTDFIEIPNKFSRINVKLRINEKGKQIIEEREETAINGEGPKIPEDKIEELLKKIEKLNKEDILVLAGSISRNLSDDIYEHICEKIYKKYNKEEEQVKIVVDATGKLLINVLKYKPFLIKPNKSELEEIFETKIQTNEEIIKYAKKLQEMGAGNVLISMDQEGAILLTKENSKFYLDAPKGKVINTVGAGDSMVAGFLAGYLMYDDYEKAFKMGISAGSASAFSENLATKEEVLKILNNLKNY